MSIESDKLNPTVIAATKVVNEAIHPCMDCSHRFVGYSTEEASLVVDCTLSISMTNKQGQRCPGYNKQEPVISDLDGYSPTQSFHE